MSPKFVTLLTCTGGSMATMLLILGTLEPYIDSARMMTIAILCGFGSTIATLTLSKRRYPPPADALHSLIRQGNLSPAQQFTLMDAVAILEGREKGN
ncbi:hypothetical protein [Oscillatoria acuminata]|uniref:Uncharacterized protein n=1 Tax=Oscillatoria acuminata PCC 6304 TaxID=56110 RepID=K9TSU8_9CYAN|nr:hypothetical protein [Oscillatoria acuminata]AFY85483.1 hypothetical protein Oscil6304_6023 [Oscillatoria acuminata PCC 6304]